MWTLLKEIKVKADKHLKKKTTKKPWTEMANYRSAINKMYFSSFLKQDFCLIINRPTGPITFADSEGIDPSVSCCHTCSFWVFFLWAFGWFHNWRVEWRLGKSPELTCSMRDKHGVCWGCERRATQSSIPFSCFILFYFTSLVMIFTIVRFLIGVWLWKKKSTHKNMQLIWTHSLSLGIYLSFQTNGSI